MSSVHDVLSTGGRREGVQAAVDAIRRGELIVLPTDTVYGVAADAFDAVAVHRLLEAKGRDRQMPPPVLVANAGTLDALTVDVPAYARTLVERYWPGPLTIVLRAQPSLAWDLGETNGTVALRMPDHDIALELLAQTGPLAVSSANRTGRPAAANVAEVAAQLGPAVQVYLDGGSSAAVADAVPLASTIVDCTRERPVVLRPGPITVAQVQACAPDVSEQPHEGDNPTQTFGAAEAAAEADLTVGARAQEPEA